MVRVDRQQRPRRQCGQIGTQWTTHRFAQRHRQLPTGSPNTIKQGPGGPPTLALIENPDILAGVAAPGPNRPALVIGFAAETTDLEANARAKLSRKGCDWILGNDVSDDVFGSDGNAMLLVTADRTETWPRQSKTAIARAVAARIADHFKAAQ
jgi:phosphopantothenoylcysteine decarboxylase/phosphopantothenate--cysteine ligase